MIRPHEQMFNWPNLLTLFRISTIPLLVVCFYLPIKHAHAIAALIFAFASFTDWLDGYLARYLKQSTKLGAFLDPVADKLMVSIALVLIVAEPTFQQFNIQTAIIYLPNPLLTIPAAIIVAREIIVSALREWMAEIGKRTSVTVSKLAKVKTSVQMLALVVLIACTVRSPAWLIVVGYILLYAAAVLTIWSMVIYLKVAWAQLNTMENEQV